MEQDVNLLNEVYQEGKMGEESIRNILPCVKNEELLQHFQQQMSGYSEYAAKAQEQLAKKSEVPKDNGFMEKMMVEISTRMNTMMDKTSSHLAEMVMQGCHMGVIKMNKQLNRCGEEADPKAVKLAQELLKFEEDSLRSLTPYLQ